MSQQRFRYWLIRECHFYSSPQRINHVLPDTACFQCCQWLQHEIIGKALLLFERDIPCFTSNIIVAAAGLSRSGKAALFDVLLRVSRLNCASVKHNSAFCIFRLIQKIILCHEIKLFDISKDTWKYICRTKSPIYVPNMMYSSPIATSVYCAFGAAIWFLFYS